MTTWDYTPTCRGFDYFYGYWNAAQDYYTHGGSSALDLHENFATDYTQAGVYSTNLYTEKAQVWIEKTVGEEKAEKSFLYLAYRESQQQADFDLSLLCHRVHPQSSTVVQGGNASLIRKVLVLHIRGNARSNRGARSLRQQCVLLASDKAEQEEHLLWNVGLPAPCCLSSNCELLIGWSAQTRAN
eukprot:COSAG02_NODE_1432_length_12646_cov_3.566988_16_plen_185_part_00